MILMFIFLSFGISLATCPPSIGVLLDIYTKTVKSKGKEHRRADVLVFIPIKKDLVEKETDLIQKKINVNRIEKNLYEINLHLKNISDKELKELHLEQKVKDSFPQSIEGIKVLSRTPFIFEYLILYVTDVTDGKMIVKLPPLSSGEELELTYRISSLEKPEVPRIVGNTFYIKEERKEVYILVAKYTFLFGYGKTKTKNPNIKNLKEVIEGFRKIGIKPVVKITGVADGKTKNPKRNEEIASERAKFIATQIIGENYACFLRRSFAVEFK